MVSQKDHNAPFADEVSREEYLRDYAGAASAGERQKEALKHALDIRKFEIDLYWKRAAYFWTLIAAAFAGYFVAANANTPQFLTVFVLACLGLVFSAAWYLVNRGSKAWQRNWEAHVDALEDEVIGPLHKTGLNRYTYSFWDVLNAYPISPSKINQILGLFVLAIWLILFGNALTLATWATTSNRLVGIAGSILTGFVLISMATFGKTSKSDETVVLHKRTRVYASDDRKAEHR